MRDRRALRAAAVLAAALAAPRAEAVRSAVRVYTAREGLPQLQVTALCQDRRGFLWVGTMAGGIGRYDGRRFETTDAATGLPGSSVQSLSVGPKGELLVSTTNGGAALARGAWTALPKLEGPSPAVNALLGLADGRLYAGGSGGLFVAPSIGAPFQLVPTDGELAGAEVTPLLAAPDGTLWAGTTRGVGRLLPGGALTRFAAAGLPDGAVSVLASSAGGRLLVSLPEKGLFELDAAAASARRVGDDEAPGRGVSAIVREADGDRFWIGTNDRGAFRWDGAAKFERFGVAEGLPDARVWALCEDREGILWLGTDAGLAKGGPAAFRTFGPEDGLPADAPIYGIAETDDGILWLGAHDRGLMRRDPEGRIRILTAKDGLPHTSVNALCAAPDGGLLVSTGKGLVRLGKGGVAPIRLPEGAPRVPTEIAFRKDGALLLGSARQGLFVLEGGKLSRIGSPAGDSIGALHVGPDGTVWAGGAGWGVVALRDGAPPEKVGTAEGLPSLAVTSILADRRGGLWVGTDRGLFWRTLDRRTRVLDATSGLPDSYVYWVGEDHDGFVWAGTNRGAARIAPSGELRVFTTNDGLGADECNADGFLCDRSGRVWIATAGLSLFEGLPASRRAVSPLVAVTEVRVGAVREAADRPVLLAARHEPLTIHFAALSFLDEGATRFRYRLAGLSNAWIAAEPGQAETTYGALGAGEYVFEVTATTVDGRSPAAPASVRVTVAAPWWRRPPVVLLGALLALLAVAVTVSARERRLVAARVRLEATVAERTEELRRLNDQLSELAITDPLTGLPNRRSILESAEEGFSLARRRGLPFAVAMIDFDHFKAVNDTLGHAEGDRLLAEGARRMLSCLRTEDVVGRYGGEEFLAAFPMTATDGAVAVAERLRRAVSEVRIVVPEGVAFLRDSVTVSVGVASLSPDDRGLDDLLRRADRALYEAKQSGRDRVVAR